MSLYFSYQSDKRTLCPETQKHKTGHVIAMEKNQGQEGPIWRLMEWDKRVFLMEMMGESIRS